MTTNIAPSREADSQSGDRCVPCRNVLDADMRVAKDMFRIRATSLKCSSPATFSEAWRSGTSNLRQPVYYVKPLDKNYPVIACPHVQHALLADHTPVRAMSGRACHVRLAGCRGKATHTCMLLRRRQRVSAVGDGRRLGRRGWKGQGTHDCCICSD